MDSSALLTVEEEEHTAAATAAGAASASVGGGAVLDAVAATAVDAAVISADAVVVASSRVLLLLLLLLPVSCDWTITQSPRSRQRRCPQRGGAFVMTVQKKSHNGSFDEKIRPFEKNGCCCRRFENVLPCCATERLCLINAFFFNQSVVLVWTHKSKLLVYHRDGTHIKKKKVWFWCCCHS